MNLCSHHKHIKYHNTLLFNFCIEPKQTTTKHHYHIYMPQIIFILKTLQSMSLMKKAKDRIQWYHISYCHSMIPFPSLPVFWKPEYKINVNIDFKLLIEYKIIVTTDFKPTISSIACWELFAFDLSAVCF